MPQLGRLRWRCRRGMKELDILLARYVDERFAAPRRGTGRIPAACWRSRIR